MGAQRPISNPTGYGICSIDTSLQDQPFYSVTYRVNTTTNSQLLVNPAFELQATEDYLNDQTGPLGSAGGNWVGGLPFSNSIGDELLTISKRGKNFHGHSEINSATRQSPTFPNFPLIGPSLSSYHSRQRRLQPATMATTLLCQ